MRRLLWTYPQVRLRISPLTSSVWRAEQTSGLSVCQPPWREAWQGGQKFGGVEHCALALGLVDRHALDGQRLVLDAEQREHLVVGDVPALAAGTQVLGDATRVGGRGDVLDLDPELLGDVLAVLRDQVLRDDEQDLVACAVAHRSLGVAGGAEGLAAALLPAEDEPATILGLGQRASQVLTLEALPVERRVLAVGARPSAAI